MFMYKPIQKLEILYDNCTAICMIVRLFFSMCLWTKKCRKCERTICWSAYKLRAPCASCLKGAYTFQSSRTYCFRSADVHEWAVAYESAHAELKKIVAMCVLLKLKSFRSHTTHQTCLRSRWLQNAEQVSALVNVYSSMHGYHPLGAKTHYLPNLFKGTIAMTLILTHTLLLTAKEPGSIELDHSSMTRKALTINVWI